MSKFGTTGVLCGVALSLSAPACDPTCSDGFVELEECEPEPEPEPEPADDPSTPGDDRPGYLTCIDNYTQVAITCGPETGCCGSGSQCAFAADYCSTPFWFATCDGPEDCALGEQCWEDVHSVHCSPEPTVYFGVRCHSDSDCPNPDENPCVDGGCLGDPESFDAAVASQ